MEQQNHGHAVADLTEAVAVQAEVAHDRLALEWGQLVISRLLTMWKRLESVDTVAYEDKVAAQVQVLDEATSSLWHLHKSLVRTSRTLKAHHQQLKQLKDSLVA
jgi:uncharacterized coiled-coil protein SlyX